MNGGLRGNGRNGSGSRGSIAVYRMASFGVSLPLARAPSPRLIEPRLLITEPDPALLLTTSTLQTVFDDHPRSG